MKRILGNWLLVLGTVLGALAAANSEKAGRWVDVPAEGGLTGQFLLHPTALSGGEVPAGTELDATTAERLREGGVEHVQISTPPRAAETVAVKGAASIEKRVVADDVVLARKPRALPAGTSLTPCLLLELRESGIEKVLVQGEAGPEEKAVGPPGEFGLGGSVLAADLSYDLPEKIRAGSFLSPERVDRILAAGVAEVRLQIPKTFRFDQWEMRWVFVLAVIVMALGVALKRSALGAAARESAGGGEGPSPARELRELAAGVRALAAEVETLDAAAIHARVDALLTGPCYRIVEGRQAFAARGMGSFGAVMGPFSSGERRLNRAWSAAVDGYPDEARTCVREAVGFLEEAVAALPQAHAAGVAARSL